MFYPLTVSGAPLEQFRVFSIFSIPFAQGLNIDFTNSSLFMCIALLLAVILLSFGIKNLSIIPNKKQAFTEILYNFIYRIITDNISTNNTKKYFPFIFTIFIFIAFCNLVGMLPLGINFTVTSQIIITFAISLVVFFYTTSVAVYQYKLKFFGLFLPDGVPTWLSPIMFFLEFITYCFRPVSLSIRLAANMVAGHTIIEVVASFMNNMSVIYMPLSFIFIVILMIFEVFVALLQAYIFTTLSCIYLNDAFSKH